ncbi:MAG TPA: hypothetical protein VKY89_07395 [Thermoanaerobaculia bacterium]|nr:hypothetical protein [Thermoanaerobaculia bacterium]
MSPYRARLYRLTFSAAAAYNLAFGLWAGLCPQSFFLRFELAPPLYPAIWACLGMVLGVYGLGYAYAAWRLDRAAPFIAFALFCPWTVWLGRSLPRLAAAGGPNR